MRASAPLIATTTRVRYRSSDIRNMETAATVTPSATAVTGTSTSVVSERASGWARRACSTRVPMTATMPLQMTATRQTDTQWFMPPCRSDVGARSCGQVWCFEPVADAPDGDQHRGLGGVVLDLLAQPADVHGHGRLVAERPAPHLLQQLRTREGGAGVAEQELQQVELAQRQGQLPLAASGLPGGEVENEVPQPEHLTRAGRGSRLRRDRGSPQHRLDAQHQLAR